jgi:hypothetical protein
VSSWLDEKAMSCDVMRKERARMSDAVDNRLGEAVGHYVACVGGLLFECGCPVDVFRYTGCAEPGDDDGPMDGEGNLYVVPSVARAFEGVGPDVVSVGLHWTADSGWTLVHETRLPRNGSVFVDRWMGGGLIPEPDDVCGFFQLAMLGISRPGGADRPRYRRQGVDRHGLYSRLAGYSPRRGDGSLTPQERLRGFRHRAALRLVAADIVADDTPAAVPMTRGEIRALTRLLEYAETGDDIALGTLCAAVVDDLRHRTSSRTVPSSEVIGRFSRARRTAATWSAIGISWSDA